MSTDNSAKQSSNNNSSVQHTKESNVFDPSALKLSQNYSDMAGVKKLITTIPVRKPGKQDFVRTHPDSDYRLDTAVLELKEERETYLVNPDLWSELLGELISKSLVLTINRQKVLSLWPIRLPGVDGRIDNWNASAAEAAVMAQDKWIRVSSSMSMGAYEIFEATGEVPEPEWPNMSMEKILEIAFKGRYIDTYEHPVLKRLRGEM